MAYTLYYSDSKEIINAKSSSCFAASSLTSLEGINTYLVSAVDSAARIAEHLTDLDRQTVPCDNVHHCITTLSTVSQTYNCLSSEIHDPNYMTLRLRGVDVDAWARLCPSQLTKISQLAVTLTMRLTKYALKLTRKVLAYSHADLDRHLTLMQVRNDEICPLCQEAEKTTLHLLGKCCVLINKRLEILRSHCLEYEDFALLHWRSLLRLAKTSKRCWISGLRTGPIM